MSTPTDKEIDDILNKLNKHYHNEENTYPWYKKFFYMILGLLFVMPIAIASFAYTTFSYGYVGMRLWEWFIIPIFHMNPITILQCAGIFIFVRLFVYVPSKPVKNVTETTADTWGYYIGVVLLPWAMFIFGYIIHKLM
jgi:uncharacterized BrkB/YihY/UPF0761 family membrane protein